MAEGAQADIAAEPVAALPIAVAVGRLGEFDPNGEDWAAYEERVEQFFVANGVADNRKVAVFFTLVGAKAYALISGQRAWSIFDGKELAESNYS